MKRLIEKMVLPGLVMAWRLAGLPIFRSPPSVKATTEGVVRSPSLLMMTVGWLPSMTDTHEFVVPRSIPIIFPIVLFSYFQFSLFTGHLARRENNYERYANRPVLPNCQTARHSWVSKRRRASSS